MFALNLEPLPKRSVLPTGINALLVTAVTLVNELCL
jgi:hypothetical protein